jgi:alkaline phosphatase
MIGMRALFLAFAVLAVSGGQPAAAQTIYPLTRAEILVGAKFDFKVEFSSTTTPKEVKVTVNGRDAAQVFGGSGSHGLLDARGFPHAARYI